MKPKELIRKLKQQGAVFEPGKGKGSHLKVTFNGARSVVPSHGTDLSNDLVKTICKQLGIDPKEL